jgi:hypothetical protein|tara:strand:- start:11724 stop:11921 length:198 start_codon:yes stop_codon:yes gene_type:complete
MKKYKYIVVKMAGCDYTVGRCLVNQDNKYTAMARTASETSAKLIMNALVEYESQHGAQWVPHTKE